MLGVMRVPTHYLMLPCIFQCLFSHLIHAPNECLAVVFGVNGNVAIQGLKSQVDKIRDGRNDGMVSEKVVPAVPMNAQKVGLFDQILVCVVGTNQMGQTIIFRVVITFYPDEFKLV